MKRPHTIVIAEDDFLLVGTLTDLVEELGFRVASVATTEADALEMVLRLRPDVVLMDIRLAAEGSGISAAQAIRRQSNVPIVFCTSYADRPDVRESVQELGHAAIIGKPFDNEQLAALLAQAVAGAAQPAGRSPQAVVSI